MSQFLNEIDANFATFTKEWPLASARNLASLSSSAIFKESYRRITALQALKVYIIEQQFTSGSVAFFYEAHNDALVSHVNASIGSWRSALQSLRSCIENILSSLYYADHPVELALWALGEHRITLSDLLKYFERHPRLTSVDESVTGIKTLRSEYATLSKAVHGSAANFRMTDQASTILLWSDDRARASMWATREKKSLEAISLCIIALHAERLQGAALAPLRDVLALSVGSASRRALKRALHVHIPELN